MNEPKPVDTPVGSDSGAESATRSSSICAIAYVLFSLTLGILVLQAGLMAIHQLEPNWALVPNSVIPLAGLIWSGLASVLILKLRLEFITVPQPAAIAVQRIALRAGGLLIAGKFVLFEIGKLRHNAEMEQFFRISGYPIWLHYGVVALELTGAVGVLLPIRRIRTAAAAVLLAIMVAAIATHLNNGDRLSDSYDALLQAVYLVVYLGLSHARLLRLKFEPECAQ